MRAILLARRAILALVFFGVAFGYLEAAVVVYLRTIYDPIRAQVYPGRPPGELFPLLKPRHLPDSSLLIIELGREASTLIMLAAAGLAVSRNGREWLAAFAMVFGIWDIFFYVFLKVMIHWPASLFTWDILFLLPGPWVGPVISPVIVSMTMIAAGMATLAREASGTILRVTRAHWTAIVGGGLVLIVAFMWDWRNTTAGNWPNPFNWPLFWTGEVIGAGAFLHAWRRPPTIN